MYYCSALLFDTSSTVLTAVFCAAGYVMWNLKRMWEEMVMAYFNSSICLEQLK